MDFKILTRSDFDKAPEIIIYMTIESLGDFIHTMRRGMRRGELQASTTMPDVESAHHDQKQLVQVLNDRGFNFPDHDSYMRWYRWWNRWHKQTLSEDQWRSLNRIVNWDGCQTEETYKDWRPEGTWDSQDTVASA